MAHAQKPDFIFRRNGRVHLNRQGASVQSTTGSAIVRISGSNAGCAMFRGSVRVLATHSIRQFSRHFPPVPSHFNWTLPLTLSTVATGIQQVEALPGNEVPTSSPEKPFQNGRGLGPNCDACFCPSLYHQYLPTVQINPFTPAQATLQLTVFPI
jgi:hypothetical protein